MKHPCIELFEAVQPAYSIGTKPGVCRITGEPGKGMAFEKWVADTFNDRAYLRPGDIISNEAAFTFDEKSELLQKMTGRDKLQRFRTYSHILEADGTWHVLTKADKQKIVSILQRSPKIVCLTDTGQKHIFFKHRPGFWQLDEMFVPPSLPVFNALHGDMMQMLSLGFTQAEVMSGNYSHHRILKCGLATWEALEKKLKPLRGEPIFAFAAWLMYSQNDTTTDGI